MAIDTISPDPMPREVAERAAATRPRAWRWLAGGVAALLLVTGASVAALLWVVHSASGSAWLIRHVPYLTVSGPRGALIGDFDADRIDVVFPGSGVLRLDAPRWQGLVLASGDAGRWLRLRIATLHADRVTWLAASDRPQTTEPAQPPQSLRLPLEIEIGTATVDALRIGDDDATPVRMLRARVHLGADGGARHRFDDVAASRDRLRATGAATIDADRPLAIDARVSLVAADDAALPWQASVEARGPLDSLDVRADAHVAAREGRAAQSLTAHAVVRPFAPWPLGELQASTAALDLAVFASGVPATSLSGRAIVTTNGLDQPALVSIDVANARAGRWNEGRLPVRRLEATLRARPDAAGVVDVETLKAELGASDRPGGRIAGRGRWSGDTWNVAADLDGVLPVALDGRAPQTSLAGTVALTGSGFAAAPEQRAIDVVAQLAGTLADPRLPRGAPKALRLRVEGRAMADAIEVRVAEASLGDAKASGTGKLVRTSTRAPWRASGKLRLVGFDPLPWWPGRTDSPLARGTNRINAEGDFDLVPAAARADSSLLDSLAATRGHAEVRVHDSALAGVAVKATASVVNNDGRARTVLDVVAAGNHANGHGLLGGAASTADDWQLAIDAPALDKLAVWFGPAVRGRAPTLAGALAATAHIEGRWPALRSDGELHGSGLRYAASTVRRADGRWRLGSGADAALDASLALDGVDAAGRAIEHAAVQLSGTARAHRGELRIDSAALPPEWADAIASSARTVTAATAAASSATPTTTTTTTTATATATAASAPSPSTRSVVLASFTGGLVDADGARNAGWRGSVGEVVARSTGAPTRTWLHVRDLHGSVFWAGGPARVSIEPGAAEALGATVRWTRIAWRGGENGGNARLDAHATVEPMPVAPLLRVLQPGFGWGGDLTVGAHIDVQSAPDVVVDAVVERGSGDLTVTEGVATSPLGFSELRAAIVARNGVWNFTAGVAGSAFGTGSAAVVARTSGSASWPGEATPIDGVVELHVARLGTWGTWLPTGWRLEGELHANAKIEGRFGAPTYTGHVEGSRIAVRNFLQGVNISDGTVAIALQGDSARIETFTAKAGDGTVRLEGSATFGAAPVAALTLVADKFRMLGRVDRRIVASGRAAMRLDASTVALDGSFKVDEGLVDFTRSDAPTLGDDVEVVRRPRAAPAAGEADAAKATPVAMVAPASRKVALDLRVDMGQSLRVRGRGLDAGLRGELRLTSPGGRLAVDGTLRAVDGTYQAYGQKLVIDRGVLGFAGPVENPRLDIEATRPNLDVRVGVLVTGSAQSPRIRLFSEPDMSEIDKLSWLVVGRASETVDGADTALLQQAALALLAGEGPGVTDRIVKSIGFDQIGVRQGPSTGTGDVKDTIVTLGKQISQRWYVGYERGLNATTGSWQLIYRVAQRVSVRAQAGDDNAIDLHWILRWN
ncbi:MAG TPA: translocation/assembly module TamB domain-containing protein [Caldimonas sp.]|jgi:translocation and assembly module TamB